MYQSETYSVLDCIFYDTGTTGTVPDMIKKSPTNNFTVLSDTNGLNVSNTSTTDFQYVGLDKQKSSSFIFDWIDWVDFAFEFEVVSNNNCSSSTFELRPQVSTIKSWALSSFSPNDKVRVEYTNGIVKMYKNDEYMNSYNLNDGELTSIRFMSQKSSSFVIKNIKLWSI